MAPLDRTAYLQVEEVTLLEAINALQASSGVPLAFSPDLLPIDRLVTCDCRDLTVRAALDRILEDTGLRYVEAGRRILIGRADNGNHPPPLPPGVIEGLVVEAEGERPVSGAEVILSVGNRRTLTGDDGRFSFQGVPAGSHRIRVTAIGYQETTVSVSVGEGAGASVVVVLERAPIPLAEMVIAPGRIGILDVNRTVMGSTLSREEIEAIPSLGEDPFRTLQRMPGVASGDISTKLYVRGSTPRDLLVRLDGLELFEPYHLKDWDGMFGIVDLQSLGTIDLITGGFPAEFGDKWGGVFDMRTRRPPSTGIRTTVGFSLGSATVINQGAFADGRGQWLTSLRRGFLDIMLAIAGVSDEVSPGYWDMLGKVQYLLSDNHSLSVELLYAGDKITWDDPGAGSRVDSRWANSYGWVTWRASLAARLRAETILSAGRVTRDRTGIGGNPDDGVFTPLRFDVSDIATFQFGGIKQDWEFDVTGDVLLKSGFDLRFNDGEYDYFSAADRRDLDAEGHVVTLGDTTEVRGNRRGNEVGAYFAARARFMGPLIGEAGVRFDGQSHTGDRDVAPRLMLRWDLAEHTSAKASWGHYYQSQGISELNVTDGERVFAPSERAEQVAFGVERKFGHGVHGRIEAYSRRIADPRPVYWNLAREIDPIMEVESDRTGLYPTRGRAKGLELLLSKEGSGPLSWSASYALASTELEIDRTWVPRSMDQLHTLNLHAAYRHGTKWQISGVWQYHTGWPYTEQFLDGELAFGEDGEVTGVIERRGYGPLNAERLPAYHRLDLRVTRNIELERGRLELYLDIFNAYNQTNLQGYRYYLMWDDQQRRFTTGRSDGDELLPILPNVGFRWTF